MKRIPKRTSWCLALWPVLFASACGGGEPETAPPPQTAERITFPGVGTHGIFDPSLALDPANGRLWMSYSAVDPSVAWPTQNHDVVSTRLAYSEDKGKTWTGGPLVAGFSDVTLALPAPNNAGTWTNEVSQLVYDPGASPAERWKLLWHHYLNVNNSRRFEHGWIAMKTASTPEGLAAAPETKLFTGALYDPSNNTAGGGSQSPLGGPPQIRLDTAVDPALNNCVFTEPGMHATTSALYLTLQCVNIRTFPVLKHLTVLLECDSPCNASKWTYRGTLLQDANAAAIGFDTGFSAPSLFESGSSTYLIATPVQTAGAPWADYYSGCRIYRFANLDAAQLQASGGQPELIGTVNGTAGSFNGACAYHASASMSGVLYSELTVSATDKFRMYKSQRTF